MWLKFRVSSFIVGLFAIVFVTPYMLYKGICTSKYGVFCNKDKLIGRVPILNVIKAEHLYTGKFSKIGAVTILFLLTLVVRIVTIITLADVVVQLISIIFLLLAIVLLYVANAVFVFIILNDAVVVSIGMRIFLSLFYPVGQWYIGNYLPAIVSYYKRERDAFNG